MARTFTFGSATAEGYHGIGSFTLNPGEYPTSVNISGGTWYRTATGNVGAWIYLNDTAIAGIGPTGVDVGGSASCNANPTIANGSSMAGGSITLKYELGNSWGHSGETTVTVNTAILSYSIRFVNYDGSLLKSETVQYGVTPSYSGTPTRPTDADYIYTFTGWSPTPYAANKNQIYVAQYSRTANHKTVKYWDGSQWVECYANVWDGSQWVEVEPRYWDGSQWVECTHGQGG